MGHFTGADANSKKQEVDHSLGSIYFYWKSVVFCVHFLLF